MSHSQFHSTDLFILRHAWLNLWDKHMTTGRINQVSYKKLVVSEKRAFLQTTPHHLQLSTRSCVHLGHSLCIAAMCVLLPEL